MINWGLGCRPRPMVQGIYDGAAFHRTLTRTGRDQGFKRRVDFPKPLDLAADLLLLAYRLLLHPRAVGIRVGPDAKSSLTSESEKPICCASLMNRIRAT